MPPRNRSPKLAITIAADVHEQVLTAAARRQISVSAWMTDAARLALKARDGLAAIAEWGAEHGALTHAELKAARRRLVSSRRPRRRIRRKRSQPS
jgi:hypothetical protein